MHKPAWSALLCAGLLMVISGLARAEPVTADEVLQAYIDAAGGHAALARIQSRRSRTTISSGLLRMKAESTLVRPNLFEDRGSFLGFPTGSGYDGRRGWSSKRGTVGTVQGVELARALRGHSLDWDRQLRRWYPARRRLPDAAVGGVKVRVVEMAAATGEQEIWRFDAGTGLLHQLEGCQFEKGEPPKRVVSTFGDYRSVDGIRLPFRMTATDGRREFVMEMTALEHNGAVAPIRAPLPD